MHSSKNYVIKIVLHSSFLCMYSYILMLRARVNRCNIPVGIARILSGNLIRIRTVHLRRTVDYRRFINFQYILSVYVSLRVLNLYNSTKSTMQSEHKNTERNICNFSKDTQWRIAFFGKEHF